MRRPKDCAELFDRRAAIYRFPILSSACDLFADRRNNGDVIMRIIGASLLIGFVTCLDRSNQAAATLPAFEVASIRQSSPRSQGSRIDGGPGTKDPARFTAVNVDLLFLVRYAFNINPHQYEYPSLRWIDKVDFDVNANVPPGTTKEQFHLMLQNLLIERFGLKFHWDSKVMPAYELVVTKSGPKLKESAPGPDEAAPPFNGTKVGPDGFPVLPAGKRPVTMMAPGGKLAVRGHEETAEDIAAKLSSEVGRPVINRTGLKGKFDYTLHYQIGGLRAEAPPSPSDPADSSSLANSESGPTLFEALQQQLGLKLQPSKGPVPVFVIDHANKVPTEN